MRTRKYDKVNLGVIYDTNTGLSDRAIKFISPMRHIEMSYWCTNLAVWCGARSKIYGYFETNERRSEWFIYLNFSVRFKLFSRDSLPSNSLSGTYCACSERSLLERNRRPANIHLSIIIPITFSLTYNILRHITTLSYCQPWAWFSWEIPTSS